MKLGERLRELRQERNLRLSDVAEATALSAPYVCDMELGRGKPSLDTLWRLAVAYDLSVHDLLAGVDFMGRPTSGALPLGLAELQADSKYGPLLTPEWLTLLCRLEYRGKRPRTADEYLELLLHLRRVVG